MDRRTFVSTTVAAATSSLLPSAAYAQPIAKAKNVVLIHGLFADGSCWSEVISRLQASAIQATAVQNPLTTLEAAVAATEQVLAWQEGPTVLVAHSFGGMILTEAGVDPKVSAVVYVAARAPDAGKTIRPLPPGSLHRRPRPALYGRMIGEGSVKRHSCATLPVTCPPTRRGCSTPCRLPSRRPYSPTRPRMRRGVQNRVGMPCPRKIARSTRISSASWLSAWAPKRSK